MKRFFMIILILSTFATVATTASAATVNLNLSVKDSKILFDNKTDSFTMLRQDGTQQEGFSCINRTLVLNAPMDILKGPYAAASTVKTNGALPNVFQDIYYTECRNENRIATLWLQDQSTHSTGKTVYGEIPLNFLHDDFKLEEHQLVIAVADLGQPVDEFFECKKPLSKIKTKETENYLAYDISTQCESVAGLGSTGLPDFIAAPGPYASVLSYGSQPMPPVKGDSATFDKVVDAFLKLIPAGTYSGAMSTLSKTCDLDITFANETLTIKHIITASGKPRTRVLTFQAKDLRGFVQGSLYDDLNEVTNKTVGIFSAAEFNGPKGPMNIRFEQNDNKEGQILRINGPEAYCRRLIKK